MPKPPKPPRCPPDTTWVSTGYLQAAVRDGGGTPRDPLCCRHPWHSCHAHSPGTGTDGPPAALCSRAEERRAGTGLPLLSTHSCLSPRRQSSRASQRSCRSLHALCVHPQELWTKCAGTEPVAAEKHRGHGQSQLLPGDVTRVLGGCRLTATQLGTLLKGKACFAGLFPPCHAGAGGF